MDLELHGGVSTHLDSLRIAAFEPGSFVFPPIFFCLHLLHGEGALEKSHHGGVMLASNTEIWHLVTSRPYWVHGQRLCKFGFLLLPMGIGLYSLI